MGRPKGSVNRERAEALAVYRKIVMSNVHLLAEKQIKLAMAGNVHAIHDMLDRVLGKATQPIEMSGPDGNPIETRAIWDLSALSTDELRTFHALISRIAPAAQPDRDGTGEPLPN